MLQPAGQRLSRRLQTRLDVAQHCQHFGRVRVLPEQHLAFLHRQRVRTDVEICFRQLARSAQRVIHPPEFGVGFL